MSYSEQLKLVIYGLSTVQYSIKSFVCKENTTSPREQV